MLSRIRRILFILLSCILTITFSIYIIKTLGLKTVEIEKTTLEDGININAFLIQKEDIIHFNGKNSIEKEVKEGIKVSLDSIIANTKGAVFNNQDFRNLEIINWKLKNGMYQEKVLFKQDLEKINQEIKKIDINIESEKKLNKYKNIEKLESEKNELIHKREVIEGSFRFAFMDSEVLNEMKSKLLSNENTNSPVEGQITLKDMGICYPGYIFYGKDGLENLLHRDLLGKINSDYYYEIEKFFNKERPSINTENQQILKFIDDTKLYLIIKVPKKFLSEEEEKLIRLKNDINSQWLESGQTNIYDFIENRRDIIRLFPEIKIEWKGEIIKGILIDSNNESMDNEKVITIKIDSLNHKLIGERQLEIYICDNLYKGFIIPNTSIILKDGKYGVILLGKANEEIFVEVFVKNKLDKFMILDPEENIQLKPGDKILARPK